MACPADVQVQLTAFAKQCLAEMAPKYVIEVFQEAELLVNITQHVLVPKHQVRKLKAAHGAVSMLMSSAGVGAHHAEALQGGSHTMS